MFGRFLIAALAMIAAAPAAAKWREASSDHFIIYSEESEGELRAFAERLETFDAAMRHMSGIAKWVPSSSNRLTIYVVSSADAVQKLFDAGGEGVAGFYVPRAGGSLAIVPRSMGEETSKWYLGAETVLLHEYAHHFMFQNYTAPAPAWLTEGYAEFYSTAKFEKDGVVGIGLPALHRAYGLINFRHLSLSEMMDYRSGTKLSFTERENLYGRGWLLTHFLTFDPAREGQLDKYLKDVAEGRHGAEAAAATFGDLKTLERELHRYMKRPMTYLRLNADLVMPGEIKVRSLRPGEDALMDLRIRSDRGVDRKKALELVPLMRARAAPFPEDPWVQTVLAEAEYDAGNLAEAGAAVDRALAAAPAYIEAMIYKGRIELAQAKGSTDAEVWKAARQWFLRANRADTEDPRPLLHFYESFVAQGIRPSKSAIEGLYYASNLAREDSSLRMMAAHERLLAGDAEKARLLLSTIAFHPHGGSIGETASTILTALETGGVDAALKAEAEASKETQSN